MKKILTLALCVIFGWGAVALWNFAEPLGELTDTNAQLFDFFAAIALFSSLICASLYTEMKDVAKYHVTDEAYIELQRQIQDLVDTMEKDHEVVCISADITEEVTVFVSIEMNAESSQLGFRDDAWGQSRMFTEVNWRCECTILDVFVMDEKGEKHECDFDESNLDLEFETTEWK
jgi:hypothetical protein